MKGMNAMKKCGKMISVFAAAAVMSSTLVIPVVADVSPSVPAGEELIYYNNFNATTAEELASWYGINGDSLTGGTPPCICSWGLGLVDGTDGNGIAINLAIDTRDYELAIPATTEGIVKLTYDFYPSAGTDVINLAGNHSSWNARTALMSVSGLKREWLKAEISVDLDKDTARVNLRDTDGNVVYTNSIAYEKNLYLFEFSRTVTGGTAGDNIPKAAVFDNLLVTKVLEAAEPVTISVEADGNGTVTGAGTYYKGSPVTLKATPAYGFDFAGWYDGSEKVSDSAEYTFVAAEDKTFIAKFDKSASAVSFDNEIIKFGTDFETLTAAEVAGWYTDEQITNGGFRSWTKNGVVPGYTGGTALSPTYGMTAAERSMEFYPVPKPIKGVQHFRFDFKPGTVESAKSDIKLVNGNNKEAVRATILTGATAKWGNEWVNVDVRINYDTSSWSIAAVPYNSSLEGYTSSGTWSTGDTLAISFDFSTSAPSERTADNTPAIDNFFWTTEIPSYSTAPYLLPGSFSVFAENVLQKNLNDVLPTTNRVTINFGQYMDAEDMNGNNIYITEKNSNNKLLTVGTYTDGVYSISLSSLLMANTSYSIHVKPVKNTSGIATSGEYILDFTVGEGICISRLKQLVINNTAVTTVAETMPGARSKIEFDYANTTGKEQTLYIIVAYYNDDMLIKADYFTKSVSADIASNTYSVDYTVPSDVSGYDAVRIMSWDGFTTMNSLGGYLELR